MRETIGVASNSAETHPRQIAAHAPGAATTLRLVSHGFTSSTCPWAQMSQVACGFRHCISRKSYANCRHAQRTPANCTHAEYTPRNGGYVSLPPAATAGGFFVQGGRDFIDAVSAGLGRLCRAPRNAERSNACTTIDQVDPPRDDPVVVLRQVFRNSSAPTAGRRCRQYTLAPALSFPTQRHPINASKRASFCYGPD